MLLQLQGAALLASGERAVELRLPLAAPLEPTRTAPSALATG